MARSWWTHLNDARVKNTSRNVRMVLPSPKVTLLERGKYILFGRCFYAIGNFVGIPYCIKKPYRAGLHCGGKVDVAEATRRRRRILPSRILFYVQKSLQDFSRKKLCTYKKFPFQISYKAFLMNRKFSICFAAYSS